MSQLPHAPFKTPESEPASNERLDSWKELASYLKRNVRTVQRWEKKEGLPVYRHIHDKLGSVYAYRQELDEWRNRRCVQTKQAEAVQILNPFGTLNFRTNMAIIRQICARLQEAHDHGVIYRESRTDLYAVTLILFEMVTGRPTSCGDTPLEIAIKLIRQGIRAERAGSGV